MRKERKKEKCPSQKFSTRAFRFQSLVGYHGRPDRGREDGCELHRQGISALRAKAPHEFAARRGAMVLSTIPQATICALPEVLEELRSLPNDSMTIIDALLLIPERASNK